MQAIIRIGELKAEQFVKGNTNNWITFSPMPFSKQHSSGIDNSIVISSTPTVEIIDADLDVAIDPQYKYAYSISTDNRLKIVFDKNTYLDMSSAFEGLKCLVVTYELGELTPNANYYKVTVRNSKGEEIHRTNPLSLDQIDKVISTFDDTRELSSSGFLKYELFRDYIVK